MKPTPSAHPAARNIEAMVALELQALQKRSRLDRMGDTITGAAGNPFFVIAHALGFIVWVTLNTLTELRWDPYPFSLLTLVVALEAITLTCIVLMTQSHMTKQADKRAHLDLQINLLAEQELTAILHMLDALCKKLNVNVSARDAQLQELLKETDVTKISTALDRELADRQADD